MSRIAWVVPRYLPHAPAGAEWTAHELLTALAARGHVVHAVTTGPEAGRYVGYTYEGVDVMSMKYCKPRYDVVIGHLGYADQLRPIARRGAPIIWMAHADYQYAWGNDAQPTHWIANSRHVQQVGPPDAWLMRPHTPAHRYATAPGQHVTLINTSKAKGVDTFRRVMRALPDLSYLAVQGGYDHQILRPKQIRSLRVTKPNGDPRTIYAQTRILLAPSRAESWGRTPLEAAHSGIPTIAHPTSGITEGIGHAALHADAADTDAWIRHIKALSDPTYCQHVGSLAMIRAAAIEHLTAMDRDQVIQNIEGLL